MNQKYKTTPTSGDIKPTKPGVYKRVNPLNIEQETFSKWDGEHWHMYTGSFKSAQEQYDVSDYQELHWYDVEDLPDMKFRVKNAEESRILQEYLFELGYSWLPDGKTVRCTDKPFLYTEDKTMLWGSLDGDGDSDGVDLFENDPSQEMTVDIIVHKPIVNLKPVPEETIEFNGQKYNKKKFMEAIENLKPSV